MQAEIIELIDQCEFRTNNPFDIENGLFPALTKIIPTETVQHFESELLKTWLAFGFKGETLVSVVYDKISNELYKTSGYFDHLSEDDIKQLQANFASVIDDEIRHRDMFIKIMDRFENGSVEYDAEHYDPYNTNFKDYVYDYMDSGVLGVKEVDPNLLDILSVIIPGENYLLATFNFFYKSTSNPKKQEIFKSFLQDEARHIAHFMNLVKQAQIPQEHKDRAKHRILQHIFDNSNFELIKLVQYLKESEDNTQKQDVILNLVYKDERHKHFKEAYLKKCYQFYNILYPEISEEQFKNQLNQFKMSDLNTRQRICTI